MLVGAAVSSRPLDGPIFWTDVCPLPCEELYASEAAALQEASENQTSTEGLFACFADEEKPEEEQEDEEDADSWIDRHGLEPGAAVE